VRVELTSDWSPEQFAPYGEAVTAAMRKLAQRFPREVTVPHLVEEIVNGRRQLWLILDDDGGFVSFVLTTIEINNANGLKTLHIPSFAGDEGASTVHLVGKIEEWGREHGCDAVLVYGRRGWKRPLDREGYREDMTLFRKSLA
jgi:hypothetical protein